MIYSDSMNENKLYHYLRRFPTKLVLLIVLFVISVYLFGFIVHEVLWEKEEAADKIVSNFINDHIVSYNLTKVMKVITFFASIYFSLVAFTALALWYLLYKKSKQLALNIAAIGISSSLVTYLLKELFRRARPADPLIDPLHNYSFPSGHASSGFIFWGLLAYLIWKSKISLTYKYIISGFFILFALLIGFSRIYLRIHYASDVIAGFCVGFAWLAFSIWILERLNVKNTHQNLMQ